MIQPIITHCPTVYLDLSTHLKDNFNLFKIEGKIVLSRHTDVEWKPISNIINQKTILDVHEAIQRISPPVFHDYFKFFNHGKNTREDGCSLIVPRIKTEAGKKTLKFQGCKLFRPRLHGQMIPDSSLIRDVSASDSF